MIRSKAFDVECIPNLFSVAIVDLNDYLSKFSDCVDKKGKAIPLTQKLLVDEIIKRLDEIDKEVYVITDYDDSDLLKLAGRLNEMYSHYENDIPIRYDLFAYNSIEYDNLMIAAFLMHFNRFDTSKELCLKLYEISKTIIKMQNEDDKDARFKNPVIKMLREYKLPYATVDVMKVFALNKAGVNVDKDTGERKAYGKSLKQTSINLMWYQLLEWSIPPISEKDRHYYNKNPTYKDLTNEELNKIISPFDRYIIKEYVPEMVHYNFNDVFIVCEMVRMKIDEIRLRYAISSSYKVDCLSDARSRIADKLVTKFYSEMSGLIPDKFVKLRTERTIISFNKVIFPHIHFKTIQLQNFLNEIKQVKIRRTSKDEFNREIEFYGTKYTIATGGIHSVDPPRILKSTDTYTYVHWDYASYYPSIMIAFGIHPEHLNKDVFVKLVRYLRDTRVEAKHATDDVQVVPGVPNKIAAEALKIVINSIYGKLGFAEGYLYDRFAQMQVTINGQLMTMTLIEELELNGIHVVSANTDGIVIKLPNDKRDIFKDITTRWNETNKMGADGEEYVMLIQRDINNYSDKQTNDKLEYKGDLDPNMFLKDLSKGYNAPIVAEAVSNYFFDGIPIMETLTKETNVLKFCKTQNVGKSWKLYYTRCINGELVKEEYQRNTRFYISKDGGTLEKVKDDKTTNLCAGYRVTPLNTLDDSDISSRNINYKYYYEECFKITNPIQLGISSKGKGKTITKKLGGMYESLFDFEDE